MKAHEYGSEFMEEMKPTRIWELDFLRGFAIIMMVFDHLMYDLKSLPNLFGNFYLIDNPFIHSAYQFGLDYWTSDLRAGGHYVFVAIFLLVSGISFNFSRDNLKRGTRFLAVALLISAVTLAIELFSGGVYRFGIYFGIIHLFAVGTLLTWLLRKIWNNDFFLFTIGAILIVIGIYFKFWKLIYFNSLDFGKFLAMIAGYKGYGADYFGIAPFAGVIMIGSAIGKYIYPKNTSLVPMLDGRWNKPFKFAGRHALVIFVTHQLIIFALVFAIMYIIGYRV